MKKQEEKRKPKKNKKLIPMIDSNGNYLFPFMRCYACNKPVKISDLKHMSVCSGKEIKNV